MQVIRKSASELSSSFGPVVSEGMVNNANECDYIVCWHHDCPKVPAGIKVIELKKYFGVSFKVWVQVAIRSQCGQLEKRDVLERALSTQTTHGDLLLMYRAYPDCKITDVFRYTGHELMPGPASWRDGNANFGRIERVCKLASPVFLDDLRSHRILQTAPFVRRNMQGRALLASAYWPDLYSMICERNLKARTLLAKYAPETI
jgi:hypothetical protein